MSISKTANKLLSIQALRGVAVLLVVVFHLTLIERKFGGSNTIMPDFLKFGMFGVDLFFVISGFVMVTVTRGKFQSIKHALMFLFHRISRIYPLHWVYSTIALLVFLIRPSWVNSSQGNQIDILASYLLLPDELLPLVQVSWTLIHEVYFYIVFFVIMLTLPEKFLTIAMLLWGGVIAIFGLSTGNPYYNIVFNPLTIEFIIGCLLAVRYYNFKEVKINGNLLVVIALLALLAAILGYIFFVDQTGNSPDRWWRILFYGIPAIIIVFCITAAEQNKVTLPASLIQSGNASYSIYLSHLFTINVIGRLWSIFANDSIVDNFVAIVIAFTAVIIVGFLSYWYVEIPLLKVSRKFA